MFSSFKFGLVRNGRYFCIRPEDTVLKILGVCQPPACGQGLGPCFAKTALNFDPPCVDKALAPSHPKPSIPQLLRLHSLPPCCTPVPAFCPPMGRQPPGRQQHTPDFEKRDRETQESTVKRKEKRQRENRAEKRGLPVVQRLGRGTSPLTHATGNHGNLLGKLLHKMI